MRTALLVVTLLSLSGCGTLGSLASGTSGISGPFSGGGGLRGSSSEVNGTRFRTRISKDNEDPRNFVTATRSAGRDLASAVEAGRVEAVEYCLRGFGGSEIVWTAGPDRELEEINLDDSGALVMAGRCVTR